MVRKFFNFLYLFFFSYSFVAPFASSEDSAEGWEDTEEDTEEDMQEEEVTTYFGEKVTFAFLTAAGGLLALWPEDAPVKQRRRKSMAIDRFVEKKRGGEEEFAFSRDEEDSDTPSTHYFTHKEEGFTLKCTTYYEKGKKVERREFDKEGEDDRTFWQRIFTSKKETEPTECARWKSLTHQMRHYDSSGRVLKSIDYYKEDKKMNPDCIDSVISYFDQHKIHDEQQIVGETIYIRKDSGRLATLIPSAVKRAKLKPTSTYIYAEGGKFSQTDFYQEEDEAKRGLITVSFYSNPTEGKYAEIVKKGKKGLKHIVVNEKGKEIGRYDEEGDFVKKEERGFLPSLTLFGRGKKEEELEEV